MTARAIRHNMINNLKKQVEVEWPRRIGSPTELLTECIRRKQIGKNFQKSHFELPTEIYCLIGLAYCLIADSAIESGAKTGDARFARHALETAFI